MAPAYSSAGAFPYGRPNFSCCAKGTSSDEIALRLEHLIRLLVSLTRPFPKPHSGGANNEAPVPKHAGASSLLHGVSRAVP